MALDGLVLLEERNHEYQTIGMAIRELSQQIEESDRRSVRWKTLRSDLKAASIQLKTEEVDVDVPPQRLKRTMAALRRMAEREQEELRVQLSEVEVKADALGRVDVAIRALETSLEELSKCGRDLDDCKKKLGQSKQVIRAGESAIRASRRLRDRAKRIQEAQLDRVITKGLNDIWMRLFNRLVLNECFYPQLERVPSRGGQPAEVRFLVNPDFRQPASVLSAGNLNTAALSLFLALYLVSEPKLPLLVLDDPVQSMDDLRLTEFAALLRNLGRLDRERAHQLVVAIHDRALFDYLKLELGPTRRGRSLLAIEIERDSDGPPSIHPERIEWKEDPVHFGDAEAV